MGECALMACASACTHAHAQYKRINLPVSFFTDLHINVSKFPTIRRHFRKSSSKRKRYKQKDFLFSQGKRGNDKAERNKKEYPEK